MEKARKLFSEFKSIFVTEDVLKENESHANIVTATTMLHIYIVSLIVYILVYFNVFKVGITIMNIIIIRGFFLLVIPALICFLFKGNKKWIKNMLFLSFTILLAIADAILKYNVTLIMVIPIILASRYYIKRFTIGVSIITTVVFAISCYMSLKIGQQDINSYNLIIPQGTTITINSTLRDAILKVNISEAERLKILYIHFFLPKLLVYNIIAFACVQISQSGRKMIERQTEITKKGARIETELNLANSIQKNMLPSIFPPFPEHKEIDLYASMTPAKEVGGDFYDMFLIDDKHLAITIADVSGKGIPAALFMMIAKTLIKNISEMEEDVNEIFNKVNNMLCNGNKVDLFVTSWFGILNLDTGKLAFVNAGHNPPLYYSNRKKRYEYLKTEPNMVLASIENIKYEKYEMIIEPGDRIFLYTDGVVEATNYNNELYGEDRLQLYLNNNLYLSAKENIEALKKDINSFVGKKEQFDDITMLELNYKNKNANEEIYLERDFKAEVNELSQVQEFLTSELKNIGFSKKEIKQVILVAEEIFINIAKYAYKDIIGNCNIKIHVDNNNILECIFEDSGTQFNPLEKKDPKLNVSAQERNIGGLGIYMSKNIMDNIEYEYKNNKNILKITKKMF